jgi:hypothetical protein
MTLVWNKFVGEFVMNTSALYASQSADDQAHFLPLVVNAGSLPAADHFQPSITTWARILFLAPNEKHPFRGFLLAHNLIQ